MPETLVSRQCSHDPALYAGLDMGMTIISTTIASAGDVKIARHHVGFVRFPMGVRILQQSTYS